jgi:hypothetical protein
MLAQKLRLPPLAGGLALTLGSIVALRRLSLFGARGQAVPEQDHRLRANEAKIDGSDETSD